MRKTPIRIIIAPARKKQNRMLGTASSREPLCPMINVIIAAETTVIGPVGPLICVFVHPNSAAKIPKPIAPYSPAAAPKPDCTPKANARGKATIPAVMPPKTSPFKEGNFERFILKF